MDGDRRSLDLTKPEFAAIIEAVVVRLEGDKGDEVKPLSDHQRVVLWDVFEKLEPHTR